MCLYPSRNRRNKICVYSSAMQCADTLSWGLTVPAVERAFGRSRARAAQMAPLARQSGAWAGDRPDGAHAHPASLASHAGLAEGSVLEQDWAQIVRRSMNGDSAAWAEMVRAHQKRVYGLCYRFTGNATDAEDLTQDVFLKIYVNLASFDAARGSLSVWITTMTRNLLVDNFRRTRNQRATSSIDEGWD